MDVEDRVARLEAVVRRQRLLVLGIVLLAACGTLTGFASQQPADASGPFRVRDAQGVVRFLVDTESENGGVDLVLFGAEGDPGLILHAGETTAFVTLQRGSHRALLDSSTLRLSAITEDGNVTSPQVAMTVSPGGLPFVTVADRAGARCSLIPEDPGLLVEAAPGPAERK